MRFLRLEIDGFGGVTGRINFPRDRLALFVDRNEAGKSSVANALFFTLFGAPPGNKYREEYQLVNRYQPWDGKPFRCTLVCESNNQVFRIVREFGNEPKTKIFDNETKEDLTDKYYPGRKDEIGERITGLTFQEALQTMFLRQAEVPLTADRRSLTNTVQRIATSATTDITVAQAIEILNDSLRKYPFPKLTTSAKLENEKSKLSSEIARIEQAMSDRMAEREQCVGYLEREAVILERTNVLDLAQKAASRLQWQSEYDRIEREIANSDKVERDWEESNLKIASLAQYSRTPLELADAIQERYITWQSQQKELKEKVELSLQSVRAEEQRKSEQLAARRADKVTPAHRDRFRDARNRLTDLTLEVMNNEVAIDRTREKMTALGFDPVEYERSKEKWERLTSQDEATILSAPRQINLHLERKRNNQTQIAELNAEVSSIEKERDSANNMKQQSLLILAFFLIASIVNSLLRFHWIVTVIAFCGVFFAFYRLSRIPRGTMQYGARITLLQARIAEYAAQISVMDDEYSGLSDRLAELGATVGLAGNRDLLETLERRKTVVEPYRDWQEKNRRQWDLQAQLKKVKQEAVRISQEIGRTLAEDSVTVPVLDQSILDCDAALRMQSELEEKRQERILKESEREQSVKEIEATERELTNMYRSAGVPAALPLKDSIAWYRMASDRRRQWNKLQSETIPALASQRLDPVAMANKQTRIQQLRERLQNEPATDLPEEFNGIEPEMILTQVDTERRNIESERRDLDLKLFDFQNRWSEMGELRRSKRELESALTQTQQFERATLLAIEELTRLSEETHREWATLLDTSAGDYVAQFGGSVGSIAFAPDLSVTVRLHDGRLLTESELDSLSIGARDQVYLAIRMAITDFLSHGNQLPLICDEPFAQADDTRFFAGMNVLQTVSEQRQVIVLTCHELRHREWKASQETKAEWLQLTA